MYDLLKKLSFSGITHDTTPGETRRIKFTNYCSLLSISSIVAFCIYDSIIDLKGLYIPVIISLAFIPCFIMVIYLNSRKKHYLARILVIFSSIILTFIIAGVYFGNNAGEHYLFILFAIAPLTLSPLKEWKFILIIVFANLILFLFIEFFATPDKVLTPFPEEHIAGYRIFVILTCFIVLFLVVLIYEIQVTRNEKLLTEQSDKLAKINSELRKVNLTMKENSEMLEYMNKSKDTLFSLIAHDLRNPVGYIMTASEMLHQKIQDKNPETAEKMSGSIMTASRNAFLLLENMLAWANIQNKGLVLNPEITDISGLIEQQVNNLERQMTDKKLTVATDIRVKTVYADTNMVNVVLRNLLSNAVKYSKAGGSIKISTKDNSHSVEVTVEDQGIGMSAETLNSLFASQTARSVPGTSHETGSGLGLRLVKEFVEKNDGVLSIESQPDAGTKFTFTLPLGI